LQGSFLVATAFNNKLILPAVDWFERIVSSGAETGGLETRLPIIGRGSCAVPTSLWGCRLPPWKIRVQQRNRPLPSVQLSGIAPCSVRRSIFQATRDRNAIYAYLTAEYDLVSWWTAEGREIDRARRALRLQRLDVSNREDPFAAVIRCTADPAKADKRTRSKWSRVMRYAAVYKPDSETLGQFIRRKGGINACAARFSRCLGRAAATRSERRSA
jgi:hypothetical protein